MRVAVLAHPYESHTPHLIVVLELSTLCDVLWFPDAAAELGQGGERDLLHHCPLGTHLDRADIVSLLRKEGGEREREVWE